VVAGEGAPVVLLHGIKLLVEHPRRVRSVVLLATGGVREPADFEPFLGLAAGLEAGQGIKPLIPRIWPMGQTPSVEQIAAINAETMARNDPVALAAAARGYGAWRVETEPLRRVRAPVLAVVGSADTAAIRVEGLGAVMPALEVRTIPGADHVGLLRDPQLVGVMRGFLAANSGAAPVAAD
jgi:pimeloyl-ACP methyl ester carboxylesterase